MPSKVKVPAGEKIVLQNGKLRVPDNPIIPFIEGDGTGPDIWKASRRVFDAAVERAYGGKRKVAWMATLVNAGGQGGARRDVERRTGQILSPRPFSKNGR